MRVFFCFGFSNLNLLFSFILLFLSEAFASGLFLLLFKTVLVILVCMIDYTGS